MTDLIECLYQYTQEERMHRYLDVEECRLSRFYSQERMKWLKERLDREAWAWLGDYCDMTAHAEAVEREALFRAALFLGLELSNLRPF